MDLILLGQSGRGAGAAQLVQELRGFPGLLVLQRCDVAVAEDVSNVVAAAHQVRDIDIVIEWHTCARD